MLFLDHSYASAEENLAWDDAVIEHADQTALQMDDSERLAFAAEREILRVWTMPQPCVVVGRASKIQSEVQVDACDREDIKVLRRVSGGAPIVAGPGCLMYSVLLSFDLRPELRSLDVAHSQVMTTIQRAVQMSMYQCGLSTNVEMHGTCDLTTGDRKFSGNALRCKRFWMLYHGTILIHMPLEWIDRYLRMPNRQPEYRANRDHKAFVTNLLARPDQALELDRSLRANLAVVWDANRDASGSWQKDVADDIHKLVKTRYESTQWNRER